MAIGLPGSPPKRQWQLNEPRLSYAAAEIEADFGIVPAEIEVVVRQVSEAVGLGLPAARRFPLSHLP